MSDTSASIARGRLQTIFARERNNPTDEPPIAGGAQQQALSAPIEHVPVVPDENDVKASGCDDSCALEIEVKNQKSAEPSEIAPLQSALPPSSGAAAAETISQPIAASANMGGAFRSQFSLLSAAAAILVMGGAAWWLNKSEATTGSPETALSAQSVKISPPPLNEPVPTKARETAVSPSKGAAATPGQPSSSSSSSELMARGEQGHATPVQSMARSLDGGEQMNVQSNKETVIPAFSVETRLADFLRQESVGSSEFDLDKIGFGPTSAILTPASAEHLKNIAKILAQRPELKISVNAYVDGFKKGAPGLELSRARANSVIRALSRSGYKSRITAQVVRRDRVERSGDAKETSGGQGQRVSLTVTK
jgi:outer membrane protein OmpA-like peptidoglycan-associated protein/septum formation topological specificity factor MinE